MTCLCAVLWLFCVWGLKFTPKINRLKERCVVLEKKEKQTQNDQYLEY